jgi:hypothetical protein
MPHLLKSIPVSPLLGALMALLMTACGGGSGSGPAPVMSGTTLSAVSAYPGQFITVRNNAVLQDDVTEVVFRAPTSSAIRFVTKAYAIATQPGQVMVAVPTIVESTTGAILDTAIEVGVEGQFASALLTVKAPLSIPEATEGLILMGLMERALEHNLDQLDNLDRLALEPGADTATIDALIDQTWNTVFKLDDRVIELITTGHITQRVAGQTVVLGPAELSRLDEILLGQAIGASFLRDGVALSTATGAAGALTTRSQTWRERLEEAMESLRNAGIRAPTNSPSFEAIDAIGDIFTETWEVGIKDVAVSRVGWFTAFIGAQFTAGALVLEEGAATAATAMGYAANQLFAMVSIASAYVSDINTDQFLSRTGGFDLRAEVASQMSRLGAEFFAGVQLGEVITGVAELISNALTLKDVTVAMADSVCANETLASLFCSQRGGAIIENITAFGAVSASSSFGAGFSPSRAVDGSTSTNWFSNGATGGDTEVFDWILSSSSDVPLDRIETDPETYQDGDPETNDDYGFLVGRVTVINAAGQTVHDSGFITLNNRQVNLDIDFPPGLRGRQVRLTLVDHEQSDCGGFSELRVFGQRPGP